MSRAFPALSMRSMRFGRGGPRGAAPRRARTGGGHQNPDLLPSTQDRMGDWRSCRCWRAHRGEIGDGMDRVRLLTRAALVRSLTRAVPSLQVSLKGVELSSPIAKRSFYSLSETP